MAQDDHIITAKMSKDGSVLSVSIRNIEGLTNRKLELIHMETLRELSRAIARYNHDLDKIQKTHKSLVENTDG